MKTNILLTSILLICLLLNSCATFKSPIKPQLNQKSNKNYNAERVSVLFEFSHLRQTKGYDAIPRLDNVRERIHGFDDFFLDALKEISNIEYYSTFTNYASDVGNNKRRMLNDSLKHTHNLIIDITFSREKSFSKFFFGTLLSSLSATIIPIRYKYNYFVDIDVYDNNLHLLKSYSREASLNKWVQTFMIFLYPFHHEKRKKEELYVDFMHDVFKEIENDKILKQ